MGIHTKIYFGSYRLQRHSNFVFFLRKSESQLKRILKRGMCFTWRSSQTSGVVVVIGLFRNIWGLEQSRNVRNSYCSEIVIVPEHIVPGQLSFRNNICSGTVTVSVKTICSGTAKQMVLSEHCQSFCCAIISYCRTIVWGRCSICRIGYMPCDD